MAKRRINRNKKRENKKKRGNKERGDIRGMRGKRLQKYYKFITCIFKLLTQKNEDDIIVLEIR